MVQPSASEIAQALTDYQAQNIAAKEQRDCELSVKVMRALAIAVHKRIKAVVPTDTTTAAQWEAAIRAEWDALP